MMGFDCLPFDRILDKFGPMFSGHTPFDESGMIVEFKYTPGLPIGIISSMASSMLSISCTVNLNPLLPC
jgi:hypothetical protein